MALVVGHSQVKYLAEYLPKDSFSVFAFPGYKTRQFLTEEMLYDVTPYFSNVVLVVGANDICYKSPEQIVADIGLLCEAIRDSSPSYTKPKGQLPDYTSPIILKDGKITLEDFCNKVHCAILKEFKYALVWGSSVKHQPQKVRKEHLLNDDDVVQLVKKV